MPVPQPPGPTAVELIALAKAGNREAFGDLYERHLTAIYRYVFYRVGDAGEAEDLTETVFVKAWEALDRYRPTEAPFTAWLYRIAHNLLIDAHRTRKPMEPLAEHYPDDAPNPERAATARERAADVQAALASLEPVQQQVLTLRFIADLSHAETASIVGKTEGAIRVIQHRALALLRTLLAEKVGDL